MVVVFVPKAGMTMASLRIIDLLRRLIDLYLRLNIDRSPMNTFQHALPDMIGFVKANLSWGNTLCQHS